MELVEIKIKLEEYLKRLSEIKEALKIDSKKEELKLLEDRTLEQGFWDDAKVSGNVLKEIKELKVALTSYYKVEQTLEDMTLSYELLKEEMDEGIKKELENFFISRYTILEKWQYDSDIKQFFKSKDGKSHETHQIGMLLENKNIKLG